MGKYIHCSGRNYGGEKLFPSSIFLSVVPSLAQGSELLVLPFPWATFSLIFINLEEIPGALRKPLMSQMAAPQHLCWEAGLQYSSLANGWKEVLPLARWVIPSDVFLASKVRGKVSFSYLGLKTGLSCSTEQSVPGRSSARVCFVPESCQRLLSFQHRLGTVSILSHVC